MNVRLPWRHESALPTGGALEALAQRGAARHEHDGQRYPGGAVAEQSPLIRRFVAYRRGLLDGQPRSLDDAADYFGIDRGFARTIEDYLAARRRLHLSRAGWRAALPRR